MGSDGPGKSWECRDGDRSCTPTGLRLRPGAAILLASSYIPHENPPSSGSGSGSIAFSFPFRVGIGIEISPLGPASFSLIDSLHEGPNEARFIRLGNLPDDFGTIVSHSHKGDIPLTSMPCFLYSFSSSAACLLSSASSFFIRLLGANPSFFPLLFGVKYRLAVDSRTRVGRVRRLV